MQAVCVVKLVNAYPEFCAFYSVTHFFFFKYCQIGADVLFKTAPQNKLRWGRQNQGDKTKKEKMNAR